MQQPDSVAPESVHYYDPSVVLKIERRTSLQRWPANRPRWLQAQAQSLDVSRDETANGNLPSAKRMLLNTVWCFDYQSITLNGFRAIVQVIRCRANLLQNLSAARVADFVFVHN